MSRGLPGSPARRLSPPRRLKTTREGRWFLLLTVGVGVAAMNTGNNLLYLLLSVNLALIIVSGFLSEWSLRRAAVRVAHASEAFAGRAALLAVTCSAAAKRFPALSLSAALHLPGAPAQVAFPDLRPGAESTRLVSFVPPRRGELPPFRCVLSTRFPFALFEKSADVEPVGRLLVYPAPEAAPETPAAAGSRAAGDRSGRAGRQGTMVRGVRGHSPSDPVRDIHWKASARLARWMVKEREDEAAPPVDLRVPEASAEIERDLSRACAGVLRCERDGRPYRLYVGNRLCASGCGGAARSRALTALALVPGGGVR